MTRSMRRHVATPEKRRTTMGHIDYDIDHAFPTFDFAQGYVETEQ